MGRTDSLEKTLMLRKIEGGRRRGRQRMRCLDVSPTQRTWVWVNSGHWWWTGRPGMLQSMGSQGVRHDWVTELSWTALWLLWFPHSQWHPLIAPLVLRENRQRHPSTVNGYSMDLLCFRYCAGLDTGLTPLIRLQGKNIPSFGVRKIWVWVYAFSVPCYGICGKGF